MPARDYYLKGKGLCQREQTLCNVNSAPHTHTVAPVWRAERGRAPGGGGCVRSAGGRAAVCGAPAGRVPVSGAFSSSPYTVPLCWVWGPGIAVLWSCQRIDVCDSVRLLYLLTYLLTMVSK